LNKTQNLINILLAKFAMMANKPITNVASIKYIVLSQETYGTQNNLYDYNKFRLKKRVIQMLFRK